MAPIILNEILPDDITKFEHLVKSPFGHTPYTPRVFCKQVVDIIGRLDRHSAAAQGFSSGLNTSERLIHESSFIAYIMKDKDDNDGHGEAIGILKIGRKHLYLNDPAAKLHEVEPWCILDFFIEPTYQRHGLGKKLMDHMLEDLKTPIKDFALTGQSQSFLRFLAKNYSLENIIIQPYLFYLPDEFIEHMDKIRAASSNASPSVSVAGASRFTAPKPRSAIAMVIHGGSPIRQASSSSSRIYKDKDNVNKSHSKLW